MSDLRDPAGRRDVPVRPVRAHLRRRVDGDATAAWLVAQSDAPWSLAEERARPTPAARDQDHVRHVIRSHRPRLARP